MSSAGSSTATGMNPASRRTRPSRPSPPCRFFIPSWRWAGVQFIVRAGKCLPVTATEVLVRLKQPPIARLTSLNNHFRFRLGPDLSLNMGLRVKRPGDELASMPIELSAVNLESSDELDAYERLLTDAMEGDALLFVREDAVEAAWAVVEPVLGDVVPLQEYNSGTWGPADADTIASDVGGWHDPAPPPASAS